MRGVADPYPDPGAIRALDEPATDWARAHRHMFLREDLPTREQLEQALVDGAQAVGAQDVQLLRSGDWSVVGASRDWFTCRRFPLPEDEAFQRAFGFPELGANSVTGEFLVGAFATRALVGDGRGVRPVKGTASADPAVVELVARHPQWTRVVAFLMKS